VEEIIELGPAVMTDADAASSPNASGVAWAAVIAGAVATAALDLILLSLGTGLGLSAVSPWSRLGASTTTIAIGAIVWLIVMQVLSGSLGGYIAGRLRSRWPTIHGDEVYFRDTAHGLLSWGLALVATAAFLTTAAAVMAGAALASPAPAAEANAASAGNQYYVDMLFRGTASATPAAGATDSATVAAPAASAASDSNNAVVRAEAGRIFTKALAEGEMPPADKSYLGSVVARRTGVAAGDAERRVGQVFGMAQQHADAVRKATAHSLLWIFVAILAGAFFSSVAATIGGRQRDNVILL
jgi:hypothetical protein